MPRTRTRSSRKPSGKLLPLALLSLLCVGGGTAAAFYAVNEVGMAPRQVGPYVARRASGHNSMVEGLGRKVASTLAGMDGGAAASPPCPRGRQAPSPPPRLRRPATRCRSPRLAHWCKPWRTPAPAT